MFLKIGPCEGCINLLPLWGVFRTPKDVCTTNHVTNHLAALHVDHDFLQSRHFHFVMPFSRLPDTPVALSFESSSWGCSEISSGSSQSFIFKISLWGKIWAFAWMMAWQFYWRKMSWLVYLVKHMKEWYLTSFFGRCFLLLTTLGHWWQHCLSQAVGGDMGIPVDDGIQV